MSNQPYFRISFQVKPRAGSEVVRIDPLLLLAGCHKGCLSLFAFMFCVCSLCCLLCHIFVRIDLLLFLAGCPKGLSVSVCIGVLCVFFYAVY